MRCLTGKVEAAADDPGAEMEDSECKLCESGEDSRLHAMLECTDPTRSAIRHDFIQKLGELSKSTAQRFSSLSCQQKLEWILAGGCRRNNAPNTPQNNRVKPYTSPFIAGESVAAIHGRKDPQTN